MRPIRTLFLLLLLSACVYSQQNLTRYVDPFIGTGGHGHTFPGATMPFGMVQLSPDTRLTGWDGCSGYHYSDRIIYGFRHTHLSGTGISDYGDILLMPTVGQPFLNALNGEQTERGYAARFDSSRISAARSNQGGLVTSASRRRTTERSPPGIPVAAAMPGSLLTRLLSSREYRTGSGSYRMLALDEHHEVSLYII